MACNVTTGASNSTVDAFIGKVETNLITPIVTLLALAAFLLFIVGVVEYIRNAENDEKRKIGQQHIMWGVIGLVIIFGATAIIQIMGNFVNIFC